MSYRAWRFGVLVVAAAAAACSSSGADPSNRPPATAPGFGEKLVHSYQTAAGTSFFTNACDTPAAARYARCHAQVKSNAAGAATAATTPSGFGPPDLASAYGLSGANASAPTVAIVDAYDNPNAEADLGVYRAQYGLSACTSANGCFRKVNQRGAASPAPTANADWGFEIALDVDMVSAACRECRILLVEADSNSDADLYAAEATAVSLGATYISNSWGGPEYAGLESADASNFDRPGVSIFASTGDFGFAGGVEYPSSSFYVTAVGGTSLVRDSSARGWSETAWSGAGSGCSQYISKPSWQKDSGCSNRTVADVAAVADPATGVAVYDSYGASGGSAWLVFGGTSVASPFVAALYAHSGLQRGPSFSYRDGSAFHDVTAGSTGSCGSYLCNAGPGYDGPTGNGTPSSPRLDAARPAGCGTASHGDDLAAGCDADFDGDGKSDLYFHWPDGNHWVGLSSGSGISWSVWSSAWAFNLGADLNNADVRVGDFNGDGRSDLYFHWADGNDWVGLSTGSGFSWSVWSSGWAFNLGANANNADIRVGDFNGDGKSDLYFHWPDGNHWVGLSTGSGFSWSVWSNAWAFNLGADANNADVRIGDFNGDGKSDLYFHWADGNHWVGLSTGSGFSWDVWSYAWAFNLGADANNADVRVSDFSGDGKSDLYFHWADGNHWVASSTGAGFAWGVWSNAWGFNLGADTNNGAVRVAD